MGISINNASKKFGGKPVLDGLSLELPQNGTVCFFGPSGCGKTTLLRCIAGLEKLDAGTVSGVKGQKLSFLFQEDRLLPWCTAQENVAVVLACGKKERCAKAGQWLGAVGLADSLALYPRQMSGGMRQRAAAARALAYGGDVFFLDEPFQKLDGENKRKLMELFRRRTEGKLTLLVTHDMDEALRLAGTVYVLSGPPLRIAGVKKVGI